MFDEFMGLPLHVLVVHAAVVFIPLLVLAAVVYAVLPRLRPKIGWAVVLLAIAGAGAATLAKLSGDAMLNRLTSFDPPRIGGPVLADVQRHQDFGTLTMWFTLGLAAVTLVLVAVTRRTDRPAPGWLNAVLSVVAVLLALASAYYAFRTGDLGARIVWGSTYST